MPNVKFYHPVISIIIGQEARHREKGQKKAQCRHNRKDERERSDEDVDITMVKSLMPKLSLLRVLIYTLIMHLYEHFTPDFARTTIVICNEFRY